MSKLKDVRITETGKLIIGMGEKIDLLQDINAMLLKELENIANVDWRAWDMEFCTPQHFVDWAKSRARHTIAKAKGCQA